MNELGDVQCFGRTLSVHWRDSINALMTSPPPPPPTHTHTNHDIPTNALMVSPNALNNLQCTDDILQCAEHP